MIDASYRAYMLIPVNMNDWFYECYSLAISMATIPLIVAAIFGMAFLAGNTDRKLAAGTLGLAALGNLLIAGWNYYYLHYIDDRDPLSLRKLSLIEQLMGHKTDPDNQYYFLQDKH